MVKIITGKINSGKTTRLNEIYQQEKKGDGIISKKVMEDKNVYGYLGMRLSDNFEFIYMIHENIYYRNISNDIDGYEAKFIYSIGPYKIYKSALKKIRKIYKELIENNVEPLYFDEVGKLELNGLGTSKWIKKALDKELNVYMTVREDFIEEVIENFSIKEYEIINKA